MPRTFTGKKAPDQESAKIPESKFTGTVHEVDVLDGSGSMAGGKFKNGVAGINKNLELAKAQSKKLGLNTTYSICQFGSNYSRETAGNILLANITSFNGCRSRHMGGMTYLYGTIVEVIAHILGVKAPEDKVLLRITTDGQNNVRDDMRGECAQLLKKVQAHDNFTVTFVGTETDIAYVTRNLNIDESNTLVYDNTAEGLEKAYMKTASASTMYRSAVTRGEDVSLNFYSKSI